MSRKGSVYIHGPAEAALDKLSKSALMDVAIRLAYADAENILPSDTAILTALQPHVTAVLAYRKDPQVDLVAAAIRIEESNAKLEAKGWLPKDRARLT